MISYHMRFVGDDARQDALPHRRLTGECHRRQTIVDDDALHAFAVVFLGELAALDDTAADRLEIAGQHEVHRALTECRRVRQRFFRAPSAAGRAAPSSGIGATAVTACTPGSACSRSFIVRMNAARPSTPRARTLFTWNVSTPFGSKPGSMRVSATKVRIIRPAPISRTSDSATSAMTTRVPDDAAPRRSRRAAAGAQHVHHVRPRRPNRRASCRTAAAARMPLSAANARTAGSIVTVSQTRQVARPELDQRFDAELREQQTQQHAGAGNHEALGQQLPEQPPARCRPARRGPPARARARRRGPAAGSRRSRRRSAARTSPPPSGRESPAARPATRSSYMRSTRK